jgi:hypothetical protein
MMRSEIEHAISKLASGTNWNATRLSPIPVPSKEEKSRLLCKRLFSWVELRGLWDVSYGPSLIVVAEARNESISKV